MACIVVTLQLNKLPAKDPLLSLEMIHSLSLHESVFWLPDALSKNLSGSPAPRTRGLVAASILDALLKQSEETVAIARTTLYSFSLPPIHPTLLIHATNSDVKRRLYLAAALTPFRGLTIPEKKRLVPATEAVIREGLKVRVMCFHEAFQISFCSVLFLCIVRHTKSLPGRDPCFVRSERSAITTNIRPV